MIERIERPLIELTLKKTRGNQIRAAQILGINRNTLRKRLRLLGLLPGGASGSGTGARAHPA